jgi:hypothetical protein
MQKKNSSSYIKCELVCMCVHTIFMEHWENDVNLVTVRSEHSGSLLRRKKKFCTAQCNKNYSQYMILCKLL